MSVQSEVTLIDPVKQCEGRVHSVESFGTQDGPGTRFVVFLQGCLFKCQYCHNRDTWDLRGGTVKTAEQLVSEILPYRAFFEASGGGVTITGGEAVLQIEFVAAVFQLLKAEGIHTTLDTNGYVGKYNQALDKALEHTDLVMLDLKQINEEKHHELTHVSNKRTLRFARFLAELGKPTWIRYVVVPGFTDDEASAHELGQFVSKLQKITGNIEKIELLPYHQMGVQKWGKLGEEYPLEGVHPPPPETMAKIKEILQGYQLKVTI